MAFGRAGVAVGFGVGGVADVTAVTDADDEGEGEGEGGVEATGGAADADVIAPED